VLTSYAHGHYYVRTQRHLALPTLATEWLVDGPGGARVQPEVKVELSRQAASKVPSVGVSGSVAGAEQLPRL
jgi:hypothetical protein